MSADRSHLRYLQDSQDSQTAAFIRGFHNSTVKTFLKIFHHTGDGFLIQHLAPLIADGINPAADIQHGGAVGRNDAGSGVGVLHDIFQDFSLGDDIQS